MSCFGGLLSVKHSCARRPPPAAAAGVGLFRRARTGHTDPLGRVAWLIQLSCAWKGRALLRKLSPDTLAVAEADSGQRCPWDVWDRSFCPDNQQFVTLMKKWVYVTTPEGNTKVQRIFKAWALGGPFPDKSPHDCFQEELCWVCPLEKLTEQQLHQPQPFTLG